MMMKSTKKAQLAAEREGKVHRPKLTYSFILCVLYLTD